MTQSQTGIQVKDLQNIVNLQNSASILALTDYQNNTVNLINLPDFMNILRGIKSIPAIQLGDISGSVTLEENNVYCATVTDNVTFVLPTFQEAQTTLNQILIQLYMPTVKNIVLGTDNTFFNQGINFNATGIYNIFYEYDIPGGVWVVGSTYKGTVS